MKADSPHPNKSGETVAVTEIEEGSSREVVRGLLLLCAELLCRSLSRSSHASQRHLIEKRAPGNGNGLVKLVSVYVAILFLI